MPEPAGAGSSRMVTGAPECSPTPANSSGCRNRLFQMRGLSQKFLRTPRNCVRLFRLERDDGNPVLWRFCHRLCTSGLTFRRAPRWAVKDLSRLTTVVESKGVLAMRKSDRRGEEKPPARNTRISTSRCAPCLPGHGSNRASLLDLARQLVLAESPSDAKAAVDACVALAADAPRQPRRPRQAPPPAASATCSKRASARAR